MDELLAGLKAIAETTRLRVLHALSHGEFNVSELTQILGQSQPRVSRHLKLMTEAGLLARHKEGSWVLFRLREEGAGGALAARMAELLPAHDPILARDLARIEATRHHRAEAAQLYFRNNATNWEELRSLHVRDEDVEAAMLGLLGTEHFGTLADLGTGTGRILELLAPRAHQAIGIDSSREMLAIARVKLEAGGHRNAQVRHGDVYALPLANASADLVVVHQVLHYLDDPARAVVEAGRVLKPGGRMVVVDFAPHDHEHLREEHAHRRLGIASELMAGWFARAGFVLQRHDVLPPPWLNGHTGLTVSLWLAQRVAKPEAVRSGRIIQLGDPA